MREKAVERKQWYKLTGKGGEKEAAWPILHPLSGYSSDLTTVLWNVLRGIGHVPKNHLHARHINRCWPNEMHRQVSLYFLNVVSAVLYWRGQMAGSREAIQ